ncbi:MAG: hypothetical protein LUI13_03340 [Lachnospiraceae bacterium]|nr:hypothetical protein [Lachnospiraceae bacterium]
MDRYEKLNNRLQATNIYYGKVSLNPSHYSALFYVVDHAEDMDFIQKEALQMVMQTGVTDVFFYGRKEALWHLAFDMADVQIYGDREDVILTYSCYSIEDFVCEIKEMLIIRTLIPLDCYLIYDDKSIYDDIKKVLIQFDFSDL